MNNKVLTRFAPSPTGKFHIGGIRSAFYNYLYARKHGGTFILRSDDTDPERSKKEYEDYFLDVFKWLGLEYDAFYRQSERTEIYKKYLEQMISEGTAYVSKEVPTEEGQREEVIRFKNPNKKISFDDAVLGVIEFDTTEHGDFVIARELDSPLYNFTSVIDDHEMGITHVIRGQEHVSNTPRQILIQEAIGASRPVYVHGSTILNEERAKLSKRDPGVLPVLEYRDQGYLPDAVLNFVAFLGWNPGDEREIFSREDLIQEFSFERMQKQGAIFNPLKLHWFNKEHIKKLSPDKTLGFIQGFLPEVITGLPQYSEERLLRALPTLLERIEKFADVRTMAEAGELTYLFDPPTASRELVTQKLDIDMEQIKKHLQHVVDTSSNLTDGEFTKEKIKEALWDYATEAGRANVLWPLRVILTGLPRSPDPFTIAEILGKNESIERITHAISIL